jgi:hypothetical protein
MAYDVAINIKPDYLHARITGDNTPQTFAAYIADLYAACQRAGCPRVLVEENLRGPSMSLVEIFEVVTEKASGLLPFVRSVAFVDINPEHDLKIRAFGEDVAVNRGLHVRVFHDIQKAGEWLEAEAGASRGDAVA